MKEKIQELKEAIQNVETKVRELNDAGVNLKIYISSHQKEVSVSSKADDSKRVSFQLTLTDAHLNEPENLV